MIALCPACLEMLSRSFPQLITPSTEELPPSVGGTYIPVVCPRGNFITRNDRSKLLRTVLAEQRRARPSVSARGLMKPAAFDGGGVINRHCVYFSVCVCEFRR